MAAETVSKANNNIITFVLTIGSLRGTTDTACLPNHFETHSLKGFGVEDLQAARVAAGVILHYVL